MPSLGQGTMDTISPSRGHDDHQRPFHLMEVTAEQMLEVDARNQRHCVETGPLHHGT